MIADETFPIELDDEQYVVAANGETCASTETFDTSMYSETCTSTSNISYPTSFRSENNAANGNNETIDSAFTSFEASNKKLLLLPPRAPVKKKKYHSCHDLLHSKKNYDHVESKVKKIIENMNDTDRQRKTLSRHKSMPISTQPPIDDTFSQEKDATVLIKELRKKSVKIYELEEKCDEKDSRIYALEYERSKMKMTFDKLRIDMHDLKEKERDYKMLLAVSPPRHSLKCSATQTVETGKQKVIVYAYKNDPRCDPSQGSSSNADDHATRELNFSSNTTALINQSLNQTQFYELNNVSSDNLIPLPEISMEEINITRVVDQEFEENEVEQKKKKKFRRFFKLMSCVSK